MGDVDAWMKANDNCNGRNACAIVSNDRYVYFEKIVKGFYLRKEVNKKEW
jgi:MinD superfamily P-loop ATPase